MSLVIPLALVALIGWSLIAHRFERWGVAGPAVLLLVGAAVVAVDVDAFAAAVDSHAGEKIVELILAILLFVDASEVRGGVFGSEGRVVARLVLIGLPISLVLAVVTGAYLVPDVNVLVLVVMACLLMPTDFAVAPSLLRLPQLPPRVRQVLNVESGYSDGLVAPLFGMALALAVALPGLERLIGQTEEITDDTDLSGVEEPLTEFVQAFLGAVPATVLAVAVGIALGLLAGFLVRVARRRELAAEAGVRFVMLLLPILAYVVAVSLPLLPANGFVAAFVAGIAYRVARTRGMEERVIPHAELLLVEEASTLATHIVWFVLGGVTAVVLVAGVPWGILLFALLGLTVLRIVPVWLALWGSSLSRRERLLTGALGPRAAATIVFGLLAFNALPDDTAYPVLALAVFTVVGSILLHGVLAMGLLRRRVAVA